MKNTSFTQAIRRENKNITKRHQLDRIEVDKIISLRYNGNTLASIAQQYTRSVECIRKICNKNHIEVDFVDFDGKMGKGGNTSNHNSKEHLWKNI